MMSCSAPLRCTSLAMPAGVELAHDGRGIAQVLDGLEQRHHDQVVAWPGVQRAAHQADFLLQQQHLQQVAHGFGVADDVVADRLRAKAFASCARPRRWPARRGCARCSWRPAPAGAGRRPAGAPAPRAWRFRPGAVGRLDAGGGQQLGHHFFVLVRALAQIHRGQVKAEHLHRADQRVQPLARPGPRRGGPAARPRWCAGRPAGLRRWQVGVLRRHGVARGVAAGQALSVAASRAYMPVRARR
jgi:hypothetical protein